MTTRRKPTGSSSSTQEKEDKERRLEAKRREEHWSLLRESMRFLKENEDGWQRRRIKEIERIKEEEKVERLAIVAQKE